MAIYNSIEIGDMAEIKHKISKNDIDKFVELTGDDNKLHIDEEYASTTSFKKPVAHGMLGASFISTVIGTKLPGDGALWYAQNLEFLLPVRIGDQLRVCVEVINKIDRTKTVELKTDIYNQNKQLVTTGTAKVKVVETHPKRLKAETEKTNKTALIIGGTGGIGSAVCTQLAEDGFDVVIHYFKNKTKAKHLSKVINKLGRKTAIVSGNIAFSSEVEDIKEKSKRAIGNITVVVNCSSLSVPNIKFSKVSWKEMYAHFEMNIKGSFNIIKTFSQNWEVNNFGKFIAITTLYTEQPKPGLLSYITGKTALNGFVKALAFELAPKGIRINLVSPGMVDSPLIADVPEKVRLLSAAQTPLRTLASPQDVAGVVSFLASDKSNYLTGQTIRVNGGQSML